ncbi:MAG: hypothetical protein QOK21_3013 [Solirubrobacteraceae bacterium]|jgi:hypothetical protein|nr:hypothetical protein [Solirubrobacteraceae bacterium]
MPRGVAVLLGLALAGLVALLVLAGTRSSGDVYSLGVGAFQPVAVLGHGDSACQQQIRLPDGAWFDRVTVPVGTYMKPGRPLELEIHAGGRGGRVLARGRLAGGYPDIGRMPREPITTGRTERSGPVTVCLRNPGGGKIAIFGGAAFASPITTMSIDGKTVPADMSLAFARTHPPSLLASVPDMLDRASVFKAGAITPVTLGLLGVLALAGVPLLLAAGLRAAAASDAGDG